MRCGNSRRSCQTTILPTDRQSRYGTPSALDSPTTTMVASAFEPAGEGAPPVIASRGAQVKPGEMTRRRAFGQEQPEESRRAHQCTPCQDRPGAGPMSVAAAQSRPGPIPSARPGPAARGYPRSRNAGAGCAVGMRIGRLAGEPGSRRPERQAKYSHDEDQEKPAGRSAALLAVRSWPSLP